MNLRYRSYLAERIDIPIRSQERFFKAFLKKARVQLAKLERAHNIIKASGHDGRRMLDQIVDISDYALENAIRKGRERLADIERYLGHLDLNQIAEWIDWLEKDVTTETGMQRVADSIRDTADLDDELDYGIQSWELDPKLKDAVKSIPIEHAKLVELIDHAQKKVEASIPKWVSLGKKQPPSHADVETLYHASVNAKQLARTGFQKHRPAGLVGLGGSTSPHGTLSKRGISFTYDLYVAKEIARVFKELALAARGKLRASTVLDWARREGIYDKVLQYHVDAPRAREHLEGPLGAVKTLMAYYAANPRRYDPGFLTRAQELVNRLKKLNPRNIGVVAAKVDMRGVAVGDYVFNEREYRVYPENIVKIVRVI